MSKLTEAIAFLAPLGSEDDPRSFFDPERRKAMRTLLDQIENDRRQIAQLNAKNTERVQQLKNQGLRLGQLREQADADTRTITSLRTTLDELRASVSNIASDRNYWQGEARRLENELAVLREQTPVGPWMTVASHEAILEARLGEVSNEHREHVEFHLRAQAEEKLARISEIVGTTDVPEITLLARRQLPLETVLVDLFDAKLKAVAEILDED